MKAILSDIKQPIVAMKLQKQYDNIRVKRRIMTGVGFFTDFEVTDNNWNLDDNLELYLGNIHVEIKGLKHGAGFILFVREGKIKTLEGYCYDEKWPDNAQIEKISKVV